MDFFKKVGAQVGDVAGAMGGLLLGSDSDTDEDRDEHAAATRASTRDEIQDGTGFRDPTRVPAAASDDASDAPDAPTPSTPPTPPTPPTAPTAQSTATTSRSYPMRCGARSPPRRTAWPPPLRPPLESVRRDVTAAAETVRRDLGEFNDVVESGVGRPSARRALRPHSTAPPPSRRRRVSARRGRRRGVRTGADVLEDVGARVERVLADVFRKTGALFNKIKDELRTEDDETAEAAARGSRVEPRIRVSTRGQRGGASGGGARARTAGIGSSSARRPPVRLFARVTLQRRRPRRGRLLVGERPPITSAPTSADTYCEDPPPRAFAAFVAEFDIDAAKTEVDAILASNSFMRTMSRRIVPVVVEYDAFWTVFLPTEGSNANATSLGGARAAGSTKKGAGAAPSGAEGVDRC